MVGLLVLPLLIISASAGSLPEERVDSGYCRAIPVSTGFDLLPCVPRACMPTFCETGVERADGSLLCLDSDEVYPAGHWAVDDWQEDGPGTSVHFLVEY